MSKILREELSRRLRQSQVFLDVFSGAGKVGTSIRRISDFDCIPFDLKDSAATDMTDPNLIKNLVGWISSRAVRRYDSLPLHDVVNGLSFFASYP